MKEISANRKKEANDKVQLGAEEINHECEGKRKGDKVERSRGCKYKKI